MLFLINFKFDKRIFVLFFYPAGTQECANNNMLSISIPDVCVFVCFDYEFIAIISDNMLSKLQLICFIKITTANGINRHDIKPIDLFLAVWMSRCYYTIIATNNWKPHKMHAADSVEAFFDHLIIGANLTSKGKKTCFTFKLNASHTKCSLCVVCFGHSTACKIQGTTLAAPSFIESITQFSIVMKQTLLFMCHIGWRLDSYKLLHCFIHILIFCFYYQICAQIHRCDKKKLICDFHSILWCVHFL